VLLCSNYSNSQTTDSTTGNLTNFTGSPTDTTSVWNNAGSVGQQLTCWQGGDPGYCGPNPRVSAWGAGSNVINFSYGTVDLNQIVNINKALAISGSVVQLSGFNFGFTAKNGNGWDNGAQDYLSAYVKLYGSSGNQVAAYDYTSQTNRKYNWTTFNFSETFATPYTASTMGNAQYGFVGRDNNYWVGPYGPEIKDVNFSLKYSAKPDPCISDPLSSPTCPGYALATVKNSILGSTVSNASATSFVPAINYGSPAPAAAPPGVADAAPALAQASPQQQAQQPQQQSPAQQGPAAGPQGQDPNQNPAGPQDNPAQPSPQQQGPAPTQAQPAGGPPQATQTANAPPPSAGPQQAGPQQGGGGAGPSKLAMSVVKSAQANDKATQQMAVQNAAKAFEATVQSSNAASNAAVSMNQDMSANSATAAAQFSSQTTQASQQTTTQSTQVSQQQQQQTNAQQQQTNKSVQQVQQTTTASQQLEIQSTSVVMLKPPAQVATETQQQSSGTGITANKNTLGYNPLSAFTVSNMSSPVAQTAPVYQPRIEARPVDAEIPPMQIASFGGIGRAGNPLSEMMMQQRFELMQENIQQQTSTVNRNVQSNELAGGVDLASMATVPQGFNAYSFVLKDAAFYEPKEVYKNQKTVDNVRLLRGLTGGSDRLHQEMVDQQYKRGE
jgi:hypothetical protein